MGRVVSVNVSEKKGTPKRPVEKIELVPGRGVKDDAHATPGDRQVSLLMIEHIKEATERIQSMPECEIKGDGVELAPGVFAENVTTEGIDLLALNIGDEMTIGRDILLRVTRIGKECDRPCAIYYKTGDCIMPKKGIFAEVLSGGAARPGDEIEKR
jgi:MOSC domain-containing protein YiiM